jgi:hypothetical protein
MTSPTSRFFRRSPCEAATTVTIGTGILMMMQPFALVLYTYSFLVILLGTVGFMVASHLPE